jgi:hypothetical protein
MDGQKLIGLDELRSRLAAMDDEALFQFGVNARRMTAPEANVLVQQGAYVIRLREARLERNRRRTGMGPSF